jgi:hypothetical protein
MKGKGKMEKQNDQVSSLYTLENKRVQTKEQTETKNVT